MKFKVACFVVVACFVGMAVSGPSVDESSSQNMVNENENTSVEEALLKKLNSKCSNREVSSCMLLKLVTYFNRLLKKTQIELGDVEITKTSEEVVTINSARSFDEVEKMSEEEQLTSVLLDKTMNFVKTRSLKWQIVDDAELVVSGKDGKDGGISLGFSLRPTHTDVGDARKKKSGGGMGALIAAAALKIGLLKALTFKTLVLIAGKALLISKLALVISLILGIKQLFSDKKHVTYEVVAHPHHETHHEHSVAGHDSYSGWGRNYDAGNLAYRAHTSNS